LTLWQRFVAPDADAELGDLDRLLARGVRVAALVHALVLLPQTTVANNSHSTWRVLLTRSESA